MSLRWNCDGNTSGHARIIPDDDTIAVRGNIDVLADAEGSEQDPEQDQDNEHGVEHGRIGAQEVVHVVHEMSVYGFTVDFQRPKWLRMLAIAARVPESISESLILGMFFSQRSK